MKVWLVNPYGPIPGENWRDYCYTMMGEALARDGHEVIWWTSNFSHHFKKYRSHGWQDQRVTDEFVIKLVPSTSYSRNIGFGRIFRDFLFGLKVYRAGLSMSPPDCIIYSESPLSFGYAGFMLARHYRCAVIFHQMDLWPELMEKAFPAFVRPFLKVCFLPVYLSRAFIYKRLGAVMALAKPYLDVALGIAPILRLRPNAVIYNGIDVGSFRRSMANVTLPAEILPRKKPGEIWAVFAGSLGPSYDVLALIEVARRLEGTSSTLRLIIAGDGPLRKNVEEYCANPNHTRLIYVGQLTPNQLGPLYKACDIGLCTYSSRSNVEMPDKFYDYTAAGLPLINSLRGEVSRVISENQLGLQYLGGDANDLLENLSALADNTDLRSSMAQKSYEIGMLYDRHAQYSKVGQLVSAVLRQDESKVS